MRKLLGLLAIPVLVAGFVSSTAPAAPVAASIRCLQVSVSNTPSSCTYRSTVFETETLTASTLQSWSVDWVQQGVQRSFVCTQGSCRNESGFTYKADAGTTIHVTVTKGFVLVRQVVL
jgi:hypothetical protein